MVGYKTLIFFVSLLIVIHGQQDGDENKPLPDTNHAASIPHMSKETFDKDYLRGRCPDRFYQVGEECVYFAPIGKGYSCDQAQRVCERTVNRLLSKQSSSSNQPNVNPTTGIRHLVLNTPEKVKILEARSHTFDERSFAVHLPSDYNTFSRCSDDKKDSWLDYCESNADRNATCVQMNTNSPSGICLNVPQSGQAGMRVACEFTFPESPVLDHSTFRHCPKSAVLGGSHRGFPIWAWVLIAAGCVLLILLIIGAVCVILPKKKKSLSIKKQAPLEQSRPDPKVTKVSTKREDPAAEPMLVREIPISVDATDAGLEQAIRVEPPVPAVTVVQPVHSSNV